MGLDGTDIALDASLFNEVDALVEAVRRARLTGVVPTECRCQTCDRLSGGEVDRAMREETREKSLAMIRGIGSRARELMIAARFDGWDDFVFETPAVVAERVHLATGSRLSPTEIGRLQLHALGYESCAPLRRPGFAPFPVPDEYFVLELEYEPDLVWMFGLHRVPSAVELERHRSGRRRERLVGLASWTIRGRY